MSGEFKFSEAAKLYAQYVEVVEEMEELFVSNISDFLSTVQTRMQAKLGDGTDEIGSEETKEYLNWWIQDEETKEVDEYVPYLWLERKKEKIISPGVLTLIADMEEASDTERKQLAAVRSSVKLPRHCKWLEKRLFGVEIEYGNGDPVEACVEPILAILVELHRVEKVIRAARPK